MSVGNESVGVRDTLHLDIVKGEEIPDRERPPHAPLDPDPDLNPDVDPDLDPDRDPNLPPVRETEEEPVEAPAEPEA